ncbi:MAG: hypothetical protein IPM64_17150 [Phycisphaerales bacterium]|nr:hypothetical protein [Phycisphaerales bacterium]
MPMVVLDADLDREIERRVPPEFRGLRRRSLRVSQALRSWIAHMPLYQGVGGAAPAESVPVGTAPAESTEPQPAGAGSSARSRRGRRSSRGSARNGAVR